MGTWMRAAAIRSAVAVLVVALLAVAALAAGQPRAAPARAGGENAGNSPGGTAGGAAPAGGGPAAATCTAQVQPGNPVPLPRVTVAIVYLGSRWDNGDQAEAFVSAAVEDGYLDKLTPEGFSLAVYGTESATGVLPSADPCMYHVINALTAAIPAAAPAPGTDWGTTLYLLLPEKDWSPLAGYGVPNTATTKGWCGFHDYAPALGTNVIYAVVPWPGPGCSYPFATSPLDSWTYVASHEMAEALRDPFAQENGNVPYPEVEVGDACQPPTTGPDTYLVQPYSHYTVTEYYVPPGTPPAGCTWGRYQGDGPARYFGGTTGAPGINPSGGLVYASVGSTSCGSGAIQADGSYSLTLEELHGCTNPGVRVHA